MRVCWAGGGWGKIVLCGLNNYNYYGSVLNFHLRSNFKINRSKIVCLTNYNVIAIFISMLIVLTNIIYSSSYISDVTEFHPHERH